MGALSRRKSPDPRHQRRSAEGKKLLERVTRDCQEDRLHIPLDPYPVRLLSDPDAKLIRAVGTANEGHWAGTIAAPLT